MFDHPFGRFWIAVRKLLIVLLLALIAAKAAAVLALGPVPIERDALGYWRLATLAMSGDVLMLAEPIAYRTPVYPWFLAIVRALAGSSALLCVAVIQSVLSVGTIVIAGQIAARITKLPRAMVWTLLVSLPAVSALTFNATVLSEPLFSFLFMLHLLAVLDYAKYDTAGRAIWVGITFATALLTRPIILLVWIPHLLFVLLIHARKRRRLGKDAPNRLKLPRRLLHILYAAMTVLVLIAPWVARNQLLFGRPSVTEFVGRNLWVVTFQDGSGAGLPLPDTASSQQLQTRLARVDAQQGWQATWTVSNALVESGLNDAQADRLMTKVAVDAIKSSEETFAYKAFRRTVNFWRSAATDLPQQGVEDGNYRGQRTWKAELPKLGDVSPVDWVIEHRWSQSVALNTLAAGLLAAATLLLIFNAPSRPYAIWILLLLSYFSVVTGVFEIPAYRYRIVVEPLVAMVIGASIAVLLSRRRKPAKVITS